jgi:hypothetical protein
MMAHHHRAIWADQALKNVDGKMATSCQICVTPSEVFDGQLAASKVFIIS